jgi:FKBP-type peptidyl-prolyl cis-trans isomerase 2
MPSNGDTVSVHYTGTLDDGTEFDSSREREPLTFEMGAGQLIPGFEKAVTSLNVGESTKVRLEPEEAYGEPMPDLMLQVPAEHAPEGLSLGDRVMLGNGAQAVVVGMDPETVTVDANHPLAGQALTFDIQLVSVG